MSNSVAAPGSSLGRFLGIYGPQAPFVSVWTTGRLIFDLTRRDISGRYKGAMVGSLWAFITPLLMLGVYSFVFGYIFGSRWSENETGHVHFSIVLFVGLIFSNMLSDCMTRGPGLVLANANYVKKVVFPLEILPWIATGNALFHAAISCVVLLLVLLATGTPIPSTMILSPLLFLVFLPLAAGMVWLLSALGVFFRDLQQIVVVMSNALTFLAPVFYPRTMLPEQYRWLLSLNPLSFVVEAARGLVLWGVSPGWIDLSGYLLVSVLVSWMGWCFFQLSRRGFADVI